MATITRKIDQKGRVMLFEDFAGSFVFVERVGADEIRIRRAKVTQRRYRLKDLLAGITPDNLHGEVLKGPPVGKEQL
jgi:antitoxin component of MazEF toxin-antitoxin module